jgi:predicted Zn-dependent protease with MMP-like domain
MGAVKPSRPDAAAIELWRSGDRAAAGGFRRHLTNVVLRIEDYADDEVLEQLGIEDPFELTASIPAARSTSRTAGPRASCRR